MLPYYYYSIAYCQLKFSLDLVGSNTLIIIFNWLMTDIEIRVFMDEHPPSVPATPRPSVIDIS